jgi:hypothetical protein
MAGSQRELSFMNLLRAFQIMRLCLLDIFLLLWRLHPIRTSLLILFNILRGIFPAVRGYSRAQILDEVCGAGFSAQPERLTYRG